MYTNRRHIPGQHLAMLALMVASTSCGEQPPTPTAPSIASRPDLLVDGALRLDGRLNAVRITSLSIDPTSLTIGGSGTPGTQATWTATIENPKKGTLSNVTVQTYFVVRNPDGTINAFKAAGGAYIQCPGLSLGYLPSGTCTITGTATPNNDINGGGFLVPDDLTHDARFVIELRQDTGGGNYKVLATRSTDVTLFYQLT